jgi:glycerol-3-phosphate dehydrogenase
VAGFVQAAAIDSPGLAGSPAIAIEVVKLLKEEGFDPEMDPAYNPYRKPIIIPKRLWKGPDGKSISVNQKDPSRRVVCKCEKVTEAEIRDAISRPLRCASTQAVRKRTRAGMGHCQGEFCEPRVKEIIHEVTGVANPNGRPWPASSILKQRWLTKEQKEEFVALSKPQ